MLKQTLFLLALSAPLLAVPQDSATTVWVPGGGADVLPNGSFTLELTPAGGGDFFGTVRGIATDASGLIVQGVSEYFDLAAGGEYEVQDMVFYPAGIPGVDALRVSSPVDVLEFPGDQVQLEVLADLTNGTTADVHERAQGTRYWVSAPTVATVDEDGMVTAVGNGDVTVGVVNEWSFASIRIQVGLQLPTTVTGFVFEESGAPAVGAEVTVIADVPHVASVGGDGSFLLAGVESAAPLTVVARLEDRIGSVGGVFVFGGGITDCGVLEIRPKPAPLFPAVVCEAESAINGVWSVAVEDFTRDGIPDLVFVTDSAAGLAPGNGRGLFESQDQETLGFSGIRDLLTGDFDGQLGPDMATISGSNVRVALNDGSGSFAGSNDYPVGESPYALAGGDLNGDGWPDIAVAVWGVDGVVVLLGTGAGTFSLGGSFPVGSFPSDLETGDVDGDGDLDLVVGVTIDQQLSVLINDGAGSFSPGGNYPLSGTQIGRVSVAVGDVDGDLDLDIGVTVAEQDWTLDADYGLVFLNDSTGSYVDSGAVLDVGRGPLCIRAEDVTGDLRADLVVSSASDNTLLLFVSQGVGAFDPPVEYTAVDTTQVEVRDADGDGLKDLVSLGPAKSATVITGLGAGEFDAPEFAETGDLIREVRAGELDGSPGLDLVSVSSLPNQLAFQFNSGVGEFLPPSILPLSEDGDPYSLALCDLDQDLDLDLCVLFKDNGDRVEMLENLGAGSFTLLAPLDTSSTTGDSIRSARLDGDAIDDLVILNSGDSVSVLLGLGGGAFAPPVVYPVADTSNSSDLVEIADFDGDGDQDLVTTPTLCLLRNDGDGAFAPFEFIGELGYKTASGDVDGDGDIDLVVKRAAGQLALLGNDGAGQFTLVTTIPISNFGYDLGLAQFDGQRGIDILAVTTTGLRVYLDDGRGLYSAPSGYQAGWDPQFAAIGDFDGDGLPDVAVANHSNVSIHISK